MEPKVSKTINQKEGGYIFLFVKKAIFTFFFNGDVNKGRYCLQKMVTRLREKKKKGVGNRCFNIFLVGGGVRRRIVKGVWLQYLEENRQEVKGMQQLIIAASFILLTNQLLVTLDFTALFYFSMGLSTVILYASK